ncbi:hypothetical protein ACTAJO_001257 [Vibrio fluvialis]
MANRISVGDKVYVPRSNVGLEQDGFSSFYYTRVVDRGHSKIKVDLPGGVTSDWIAVSFAKKKIKALVVAMGDYKSELLLIDPLYKTTLHHLRLLLSEEEAIGIKVRSLKELVKFWRDEQSEISHVVFIGHGKADAVFFGVDEWVNAEKLGEALRVWGAPKKHFLFLCCKTGQSRFSKPFSQTAICEDIAAPFHSVHGAIASQFAQTYFLSMYLGGRTSKVAFNCAKKATVDSTSFRFWDNGKLK